MKLILLTLLILSISFLSLQAKDAKKLSARQLYDIEVKEIEKRQGNNNITSQHIERRMQSLNSGKKWRRMKIWFDMTELNKQNKDPKRVAFYKKVFEIVGKWWEEAVWINDDHMKTIEEVKSAMDAGYVTDFHVTHGHWKDYDLLIHSKMAPTDGGTLAWAGPLYRHPTTQRPVTGTAAVCWFGDKNFRKASDSINRAVGTMIHEFGHVMAFISMLQYHKHYTQFDKTVKSWMWTGPETRKRASAYYKCDSSHMKGIALQTMAGNVPGAHWSEDTMNDELMTPFSGEEPEKVSPMMLGLVEDTKWYKANYRMVEAYNYKKGVASSCLQDKNLCAKDRACKIGADGIITGDFKGIGYCEKDDKGCAREVKYGNRDIGKPAAWGNKY